MTSVATAIRLSENDWQQRVTDYAELRKWWWLHIRKARTKDSWRTPVAGPLGKGWPDLLLVRSPRIVVIELKADNGTVTVDQRAVLAVLGQLPAVEVLVARPRDWDHIMEVLA